jgi:hypothetical protein
MPSQVTMWRVGVVVVLHYSLRPIPVLLLLWLLLVDHCRLSPDQEPKKVLGFPSRRRRTLNMMLLAKKKSPRICSIYLLPQDHFFQSYLYCQVLRLIGRESSTSSTSSMDMNRRSNFKSICSNSKSIRSKFKALWLNYTLTTTVRGNVIFPYLPDLITHLIVGTIFILLILLQNYLNEINVMIKLNHHEYQSLSVATKGT